MRNSRVLPGRDLQRGSASLSGVSPLPCPLRTELLRERIAPEGAAGPLPRGQQAASHPHRPHGLLGTRDFLFSHPRGGGLSCGV